MTCSPSPPARTAHRQSDQSQFWANVYLNELDQFVKRELHCPAYLRYVDDFLLFADDKRQLWAWKEAIVSFWPGCA